MSETYDAIRSLLTTAFRVPENEIHPQATLERLELDSLALAEFVLLLHERCGVKIDKEYAARTTTVAEVADHIDALRAGAVTSP
ncbi:acyl carrier protein [Kitasatospora viridis]|uniref:Acyl carrier protein n=1 Tax=Kitasatospora viridis TaxID=281105 RepID=A0A561UGV4_9ACTN|nr:acyl carrier protein [Kitasatospora viridis]TWF98587.1 acyl carrier protein [Kitasatospora viridis]